MMNIDILIITFSLPGCRSVKEKRMRMGGLHKRFGRNPAVAVSESGKRHRHDASEWTFVVVGLSKRDIESEFSQIEDKLQPVFEARIMNIEKEFI